MALRLGAAVSVSAPGGRVLRPSDLPAADRGGGASTVRIVHRRICVADLLNGVATIPPGGVISRHFHDCEESGPILEGDVIVEIDGAEILAAAGDVAFASAGAPHCLRNASAEAPLRIFWTHVSADATRTLVATGETRAIDAEHER